MPHKYPSMGERLIANSILSAESFYGGTPCWEWVGAVTVNRSGMRYGKLATRFKRGPRKGQQRTQLAHRVAIVELKNRRLSTKSVVRHLCNNTLCINPEHLVGGTARSNNRQTVRDGRHKNMYGPTGPSPGS